MSDFQFTTEDRDYVRHGDRAMRLRLFRPVGAGPFAAVIDLHGGAWCNGDLAECQARDEVLARAGLVVAALDFRHGADGYPSSLVDINYAVRWIKAHAAELNVRPDRVALCGQSSGGHLAMLAAMRPDDARYAAQPLPAGSPAVDACVAAVAMIWPVINPLSRYRHARRALDATTPPAWVGDIPARHDLYWKTEAAMADGNPILALETGETVHTPPALWVQGRPDPAHDYRDPDSPVDANEPERFVGAYRRAGGKIELVALPYPTRATTSLEPVREFLVAQLSC
ncbi:MAG: alpha/beta hydrolase [Acetobacteraceae bacterium]|nr:alpha/beta hydrolase [Acetobacteraceae bacterium]